MDTTDGTDFWGKHWRTHGLKHRPMVLLPYSDHDGFYDAESTDCRYISVGWAQYDPRKVSVKTLRWGGLRDPRRQGESDEEKFRWSRQSEELPLHRCIDAALLIAETVAQVQGDCIELKRDTLERQDRTKQLPIYDDEDNRTLREEFRRKIMMDKLLKRRLKQLAQTLKRLDSKGAFTDPA